MIRAMIATALFLSCSPAIAADDKGAFIVGGGAGAVKCPEFLNAMATARQAGGLNTTAGITATGGFGMYVLGFATGFNMESKDRVDIFSSLTDPGFSALYAIEPWCRDHPEARFADGLIVLANNLRKRPH